MREHIDADEPFVREDVTTDAGARALPRRAPGLQGRADRGPGCATRTPRTRWRPSRCTPTVRSPTCAAARTRRAPSGSRRSSCSRSPARTGAATPPTDAHARVWDRVLLASRSSRSTWSSSSAPAPTTTAGSARSWGCSRSPRSRPARRSGSRRAPRCSTRWSRSAARWAASAATPRSRPRMLYDSSLWKTSGHWDKYRDNMFVTESEDRPMALKPMNCPGHCQLYSIAAPLLPRPAGPLLRARTAAPQRAQRHAARAAARAPVRPGRRAHLLHRGPDPGRGRRLPGVRVRHLRRVRARRAPRAVDPARAADRLRRAVGPQRGRAAQRARVNRSSSTTSTRATAPSTARRSTCT